MNFVDMMYALQNAGVIDVLFPFLLVFVVVFAVLQKSKVLGKDKEVKKYNALVSLIMGFIFVVPHVLGVYPPGYDPVMILNGALPGVSIVLIAALMILLLIGIFGGELSGKVTGWLVGAAIVIVVYIFGGSAGWWYQPPVWLAWLSDPDTQALLIIIIVFAALIWFITSEEKTEKEEYKPSPFVQMFRKDK
jgi:hypothetical protein